MAKLKDENGEDPDKVDDWEVRQQLELVACVVFAL